MPTIKDTTNPHFHTIPEAKVIPQELNFKLDFSEDQGLMEGGKGVVSRAPVIHCCAQCGTTQTPQWRNGPRGPRTLCNACGIRLHRRLNKLKLGTTQRRRKKSTKSAFKTQTNSRQHYLRTKAPNGGGGGVSRPRSQRLRSRRMREMTSNLTRVRSFRCEDFTAAIDLLSLSKENYRTIGQRLEKLPNRYESLKREIGVVEGDLMSPSGTEKVAGISGEEALRQLKFHEACSKFQAFISQQLESTMQL